MSIANIVNTILADCVQLTAQKESNLIRYIIADYITRTNSFNNIDLLLLMAQEDLSRPMVVLNRSQLIERLQGETRNKGTEGEKAEQIVGNMMTRMPRAVSEFITLDTRAEILRLVGHRGNRESFSNEYHEVLSPPYSATGEIGVDIANTGVDALNIDHISNPGITRAPDRGSGVSTASASVANRVEVDKEPVLMIGKDATSGVMQYYYYDKNSGEVVDVALAVPSEVKIATTDLPHILETVPTGTISADILASGVSAATDTTAAPSTTRASASGLVVRDIVNLKAENPLEPVATTTVAATTTTTYKKPTNNANNSGGDGGSSDGTMRIVAIACAVAGGITLITAIIMYLYYRKLRRVALHGIG
jgi:hypothetical protein